MWDGAKKTWQLKWSNGGNESKTKDCSVSLAMSPWTKQVHLGPAKLLSNYFTCRKLRENIQPCNPNVKWLLELLKKSWLLLPPIQIIVYFAFFSKSNFSSVNKFIKKHKHLQYEISSIKLFIKCILIVFFFKLAHINSFIPS